MSNQCNKRSKCKKKCSSDIESESLEEYFGCNEIPAYICPPPKNPCPLKSFCDPSLMNTCKQTPIVDQCTPRRAVTTWKINYLVSNNPNDAAHVDEELVHPRGIVVYQNQLWVANTMSDKITNYDLFGNQLLGPIQMRWNRNISSFPSGLVVNCSGDFSFTGFSFGTVGATGATRPAVILSPTKTGDVVAFNPNLDPQRAYVVINYKKRSAFAVYTGIAVVGNIMYLADFLNGHIDIYGTDYNRIGAPGRTFVDNYSLDPIPLDFRPFNIVYIEPYMYVLYAKADPSLPVTEQTGAGNGYISIFTREGAFVRRFYSRGVLNAPWSIIPAPNECGIPPGSFLVNNIGDGRINLFDCDGNYLGPLLNQSGVPLYISGIQSIAPHYTDFNEIFFTASDDVQYRGVLGSIVKDQVIYV